MPEAGSFALDKAENAEKFELYSLNPIQPKTSSDQSDFHFRRVLGKVQVDDPSLRRKLVDALRKGADESQNQLLACFEPP